jgi:hypothetical protein
MQGHHRERISGTQARAAARLTLTPRCLALARRCAALTNLGRRLDPSRRCSRGTLTRRDPYRRFSLHPLGVAVEPLRPRRRPPLLSAHGALSEPKHASSAPLTPPSRRMPPGPHRARAILVAEGTIPMTPTARPMGTGQPGRPRRQVGVGSHRCASIEFMPGTLRAPCDGVFAQASAAASSTPGVVRSRRKRSQRIPQVAPLRLLRRARHRGLDGS